MKVDFHLHTWCSDGAHDPIEMLHAIRHAGVESFAITDHDTCSGWRALAGTPGLLAGVEATAGHDHREVHIVGLGINPDQLILSTMLARVRVLREHRLGVLLARLPADISRGLTVDDVRDRRSRGGIIAGESLSRNHLARALVQRGGVANFRAAFDDWLGDEHMRDPALPEFPSIAEVTAAIRDAGGVAILAHPGMYKSVPVVEELMDAGCDGLEVEHPHLDPTFAGALRSRAVERGWLMSVGTDTHVLGSRRPGHCVLADHLLNPLLDRLGVARLAA